MYGVPLFFVRAAVALGKFKRFNVSIGCEGRPWPCRGRLRTLTGTAPSVNYLNKTRVYSMFFLDFTCDTVKRYGFSLEKHPYQATDTVQEAV